MSQDLSRILFDPRDDYLGVLLQQGRPLTDADWNALVAQVVRRLHVGAFDTFGPAVVPEQTPDAFAIVPTATGFTVGPGRIYVDGLLAQNHGAGAPAWNAHLAEESGADPVAYDSQPYMPEPDALPAAPYLLFIDVWQRDVSHLQDTRLLESAIGVDSTARMQTAWRVRAMAVEDGTTCATDLDAIPAWVAETASSAGRLTTAAGTVPGEPDPCQVPPAGGYKGDENQAYRVEVHAGGPPGTATFKWSRDNASVQTRVLRIPDLTHLEVESIGRDDVLRFADGDWIELIDDRHQLGGRPGVLRRIAIGNGVDDGTRTITLAQALGAGDFPVDAQGQPTGAFHLRLRRWDQQGLVKRADGSTYQDLGQAGATGEITIPADGTQLLLENGVLVSFGVADPAGRFHAGDWWLFAARSVDASVEILTAAPPRGVHHHYAKLAIVGADGKVEDCRVFWPPKSGCCTMVVRPGGSIQSAIDALPQAGGCVCLKAGEHQITEPVRIARPRVVLHGEAPGVRVVGQGLEWLLEIAGDNEPVEDVEVAHIDFELQAVKAGAPVAPLLVWLHEGRRLRLHDCGLRYTGPLQSDNGAPMQVVGAVVSDAGDVELHGNHVAGCYLGVLGDARVDGLRVANNDLEGFAAQDGQLLARWGIRVGEDVRAECVGNRIADYLTGVSVLEGAPAAMVLDNRILRRPIEGEGSVTVAPKDAWWAIELGGDGANVTGNEIEIASPTHGGVLVTGQHARITANALASSVRQGGVGGPYGVYAGAFEATQAGGGNDALVKGNVFTGALWALLGAWVSGLRVSDNRIIGREGQGVGLSLFSTLDAQLVGNQLSDVVAGFTAGEGQRTRIAGNTLRGGAIGALFMQENGLDMSDNSITGTTGVGVLVLMVGGTMRLSRNRLAHCSYRAATLAMAIGVYNPHTAANLAVESCDILDTGVSPDGKELSAVPAIGIVSAGVPDVVVAHNRVAYTGAEVALGANLEHRALTLIGVPAARYSLGAGSVEMATGGAQVLGNFFHGPGRTHLVELPRVPISSAPALTFDLRFEKLVFANNRCEHTAAEPNDAGGTALLFASHPSIQCNQVKGPPGVWSINLAGRPQVALQGNITTGDYLGVNTTVPTPLSSFNVVI